VQDDPRRQQIARRDRQIGVIEQARNVASGGKIGARGAALELAGRGMEGRDVSQRVQRWIEVTPSQFTHEAEGLNIVHALLPDQPPFRAWSNFEFRDGQGKWHEVDLLVLGRRRMHLVELKYYTGTLRGDDLTWRRDGHRAEDSPLKLARRKAQRLASKLQDELLNFARETGNQVPDPRSVVPFVQECVFLHHPGIRCALPSPSRLDLLALDGSEDRTGLPGISDRLLEAATPSHSISPRQSDIIAALMKRIGVVQRRQREAGSWVIDEDPIGEGDGWQDWSAFHRIATTRRARIRFLVTPPGTSATARAKVRQVAEHEYRIMSRLPNERLVRPEDMVENDLGVGLVYPLDERYQRLDLFLADKAGQVPASDQLSLLRQAGEAVSYAHRNRIVHRGLTPHAVLVRPLADSGLRVLVGDWQSAGAVTGSALTSMTGSGVTGLLGLEEASPHAPERSGVAVVRPVAADVDRRMAEPFQAPEGVWNKDADLRQPHQLTSELTKALGKLAGKFHAQAPRSRRTSSRRPSVWVVPVGLHAGGGDKLGRLAPRQAEPVRDGSLGQQTAARDRRHVGGAGRLLDLRWHDWRDLLRPWPARSPHQLAPAIAEDGALTDLHVHVPLIRPALLYNRTRQPRPRGTVTVLLLLAAGVADLHRAVVGEAAVVVLVHLLAPVLGATWTTCVVIAPWADRGCTSTSGRPCDRRACSPGRSARRAAGRWGCGRCGRGRSASAACWPEPGNPGAMRDRQAHQAAASVFNFP
jgi:nuclease-like protein/protein tyrosine kinase